LGLEWLGFPWLFLGFRRFLKGSPRKIKENKRKPKKHIEKQFKNYAKNALRYPLYIPLYSLKGSPRKPGALGFQLDSQKTKISRKINQKSKKSILPSGVQAQGAAVAAKDLSLGATHYTLAPL